MTSSEGSSKTNKDINNNDVNDEYYDKYDELHTIEDVLNCDENNDEVFNDEDSKQMVLNDDDDATPDLNLKKIDTDGNEVLNDNIITITNVYRTDGFNIEYWKHEHISDILLKKFDQQFALCYHPALAAAMLVDCRYSTIFLSPKHLGDAHQYYRQKYPLKFYEGFVVSILHSFNLKSGVFAKSLFRTSISDPTLGWKSVLHTKNKSLSQFAIDSIRLLQMFCS